jgi:hypothetical protein
MIPVLLWYVVPVLPKKINYCYIFCTAVNVQLYFLYYDTCTSLLWSTCTAKNSYCRDTVLFENSYYTATLADIASSFRPGGSLSNTAAMVGIYLISEKFAESKKLVVPY